MRVDVDAVDVVEQDSFSLAGRQPPVAGGRLEQFLLVLFWAVVRVLLQVPIEQVWIGSEKKRAGTAGGVEDAELGGLRSEERRVGKECRL